MAVFGQIYRGRGLPVGHPAPLPPYVPGDGVEAALHAELTALARSIPRKTQHDDVKFASPVGEPVVGRRAPCTRKGKTVDGWVVTVLRRIEYGDPDDVFGEACFGFYRSAYGVFLSREDVTAFVYQEFKDGDEYWRLPDEMYPSDSDSEAELRSEKELPAKIAFDEKWQGDYFEVAGDDDPSSYQDVILTIEPAKLKAVLRWEAIC